MQLQNQILNNLLHNSRTELTEPEINLVREIKKLSELKVYWQFTAGEEGYVKNILQLSHMDEDIKNDVQE